MRCHESVVFGVNSERYETTWDRTQLRLGSTVYVRLDAEGCALEFGAHAKDGFTPHAVMWISPSEWYVPLKAGLDVAPATVQLLVNATGGRLSEDEVRAALERDSATARLNHLFKTKKIKRLRISSLGAVAERLQLIERLNDEAVRKALFLHHRALTEYLLLTCFDALGQPANWCDFGTWLRSTGHAPERAEVQIEGLLPGCAATALHEHYLTIYGTRNSFYRFMREILPPEIRRDLLASIEISELDAPPRIGELRAAGDQEKEQYLYRIRNEYTHEARFIAGPHEGMFPPRGGGTGEAGVWHSRDQERGETRWRTYSTRDWPRVLVEVVREGLAVCIRAIPDSTSG